MPAAVDVVQGAPCWVSLAAPDFSMVKDFYAATLGWSYRRGFGLDEYAIAWSDEAPARRGGGRRARTWCTEGVVGALRGEQRGPGGRPGT
ncbi:hypothetical protein [Streptomyces sp. SPB162]|uniref:VOC family protein n=1 Tax=Streptomyces sp. SPB162 TaxID=2940560 RepID=UPI0024063711|nr:hypothetical protein [Streptomyces sp. SPB162]MDF9810779.1 putative enzyme related to lactoylglutathione lyase [Streptomyces sp. SPB162]